MRWIAHEWRRCGVSYIVFLLAFAIYNTTISHVLIRLGMLSFPIRPFPALFNNNVIYDWIAFPAFGLWMVRLSCIRHAISAYLLLFAATVMLLDWALVDLTRLLQYKGWNLIYTFLSASATFLLARMLFYWLVVKHGEKLQARLTGHKEPSD
jgi:hypothetical protein